MWTFNPVILLPLFALTHGVALSQFEQVNRALLAPRADCTHIPKNSTSSKIAKLPDPLLFLDGSRVTHTSEWTCRQAQISALLQTYELGTKPPAPSHCISSLKASKLVITCTVGKNTISFSASISHPKTGKAPCPAIIALGSSSIPQPSGVALITLDNAYLAQQHSNSSRGVSKFYTLYGHNSNAGAMIAWAWGLSRMIDALEKIPAKTSKININRLGVTGCSRNGKGALVAGALDNRIALTIPQESGSGGAACWRLSDAMLAAGDHTQTASEIVQENVWFSPEFDHFASTTVDTLPYDHHMLAGLIAPRGLLVIDNSNVEWLGPWSCYGCMIAARRIWEALGARDNMGYTMLGNHPHCHFPAGQKADLDAFVGRFLLDKGAATNLFKTDLKKAFNANEWIKWKTPRLS